MLKNDNEDNNELKSIISKSKYKKEDLLSNLDSNNSINSLALLNKDTLESNIQNTESFRKFYLFQIKYFKNENIFGLIHVRLAFFVKDKKRYNNYIEILLNKINKAIEISDKNNNVKGKYYIYLDLENANPKNFSRFFLKKVSKILCSEEEETVKKFFVGGKKKLVKLLWPITSLFLDKIFKKKIILLD
jgi:hypothetical protein